MGTYWSIESISLDFLEENGYIEICKHQIIFKKILKPN